MSTHTPSTGRCNPFSIVPPVSPGRLPYDDALPLGKPSLPQCPTRHLSVDQYIRLLACIEDEGGIASLDDISRAIPAVQRPISAVFDLCDAGILGMDLAAAFDGNMRVWRLED